VPPGHPDLVIARLAASQHEIVHRRQLIAAGLGDKAIRNRVARKILSPVHRGAYKVGPGRPTERGLFIAAVFAAGSCAVLSHRSAAALWRVRPQNTGPIEVTVPRRGTRQQPRLRVHSTRCLPDAEVTVLDGIPCTTFARTVLDCASTLPPYAVKRMLEQAQIERIFDLREVEAALARAHGRSGTGLVAELLADLADEPPPTRSEFERLFLELAEGAGLPPPIVNGIVCGWEVDFHWPDAQLIVETDGAETHDTPIAFHRDRQRDLDLELAGWHVIRISWRQLRTEPGRVVGLLRAKLGGL
jgi:predicted transcriptional regulator of viral defense system